MKGKLHELLAWVRGLKNAPTRKARCWHLGEILRILFTRMPQEVGQAVAGFVIVLTVIGLAGGTYMYVTSAQLSSHATDRHGTRADDARAAIVAGIDETDPQLALYYSIKRGTVLGIASTSGTTGNSMCAGAVWRVTENYGLRSLIESGEAYECTAYVETCRYWYGVIRRDGYLPLGQFPNMQTTFISWFKRVMRPAY